MDTKTDFNLNNIIATLFFNFYFFSKKNSPANVVKCTQTWSQLCSMNAKVSAYRHSELRGLYVTISVCYHWSVARQLTPFHYVIGISRILPYNRNGTLQTLELFSAFARLYNAAASPASCLCLAGFISYFFSSYSRFIPTNPMMSSYFSNNPFTPTKHVLLNQV